jgi:hypothetical protein
MVSVVLWTILYIFVELPIILTIGKKKLETMKVSTMTTIAMLIPIILTALIEIIGVCYPAPMVALLTSMKALGLMLAALV